MTELRRYRSFIADNARWDGFEFRDDDIIVCTPPKCGTTWTQTLCAMLVFGTPDLPGPLSEISPWLEMQTNDPADIVAKLEAQQHRRIIKTHTPLDGVPDDDRITYICVGRDPRDVSLSWDHHMANLDMEALFTARANAVGVDDLAELGPPPEPPPDDPLERFQVWVDAEPEAVLSVTLASILNHLQTFWDRRDEPNVELFHYSDLSADLPGQLNRLTGVLGIETSDDLLAEIATAATFDNMKQRADTFVPDAANAIWQDNSSFFHRGSSGQWRDVVDAATLAHYDQRVAALVPPDLAAWAHDGWLAS